jgi:hypothetical protein
MIVVQGPLIARVRYRDHGRAAAREIEEGRLAAAIQGEVMLTEVPAALARNRAGGARGKTLVRT